MNKNQNDKTNTFLVIACGALMVFISMGTRQSFGLFLQPITLFSAPTCLGFWEIVCAKNIS